jgi:hypothetical protein
LLSLISVPETSTVMKGNEKLGCALNTSPTLAGNSARPAF